MKKNYITPEMDILKAEAQPICAGSPPSLPITEDNADTSENLAKPGMSLFDEPVAIEED